MSTMEQAKSTGASRQSAARTAQGWLTRTRTFFTEVRNEMRRVTWPSRREVYATTVVVILTSVVLRAVSLGPRSGDRQGGPRIFASFGAA